MEILRPVNFKYHEIFSSRKVISVRNYEVHDFSRSLSVNSTTNKVGSQCGIEALRRSSETRHDPHPPTHLGASLTAPTAVYDSPMISPH